MEITVPRVCGKGLKLSDRGRQVAGLFGVAAGRSEILREMRIAVEPGQIILIAGDSGSGKSTLLRAIARELRGRGISICAMGDMKIAAPPALPARPRHGPGGVAKEKRKGKEMARREEMLLRGSLVDEVGGQDVWEAMECLARAGLADARLMLRRPGELSGGQRFRFDLARFFAGRARVLLADEFGATLDRVTAKVVAHQLRKFVTRSAAAGLGRSAVVATTHQDIIEDLQPDVLIRMG